jgi:DnaK suppressor protein
MAATSTKPSAGKSKKPLTEATLRAMPGDQYMCEAQLAFFRTTLCGMMEELLTNAGETTEHLRETLEEEHALELRTRDRERKLLKKIQQSIVRIDSGEYGWCEETGEAIGIPRLLARPTATLSIEAQQRRELRQKLYGD